MIGGKTGIGDQNQGNRTSPVSDPDSKVGRFQSDFRLLFTFSAIHQGGNYAGHNGDIFFGNSFWFLTAGGSPAGSGGKACCSLTHKLPHFSRRSLLGELKLPSVKIRYQRPQCLLWIDQRDSGNKLFEGRFWRGFFACRGYEFFFTSASPPGSVIPSPLGAEA